MKSLKISHHPDKINDEETLKPVSAGKLLKSILVIFMLAWIILVSSCIVRTPGPGHERHRGNVERHDNDRHRGHDDHHDHDDHHHD